MTTISSHSKSKIYKEIREWLKTEAIIKKHPWLKLSESMITIFIKRVKLITPVILKWKVHRYCTTCLNLKEHSEEFFKKEPTKTWLWCRCRACFNLQRMNKRKLWLTEAQKQKERDRSNKYRFGNPEKIKIRNENYWYKKKSPKQKSKIRVQNKLAKRKQRAKETQDKVDFLRGFCYICIQ